MTSDTGRLSGDHAAFISYASHDEDVAHELADRLEARGLKCWIAPRDIRPGEEYAGGIMRGISYCRCFILLLSSASNLSTHVRREVERAASLSKPIYPVRIEDVQPSPKLEYFISMVQWLDAWPRLMSEHVERLISALQSDEEWTGNKIRRRRRISFGLSLAIAVGAIIAGVALVPELRAVFSSPEIRARNQLRSSGISVDIRGVRMALVGADGEALKSLLNAGVNTNQFAQALAEPYAPAKKSVAAVFFERSRSSPDVLRWFSDVLDKGLNPNLLVSHPYYKETGILGASIGEGNLDASVALLQHGASPHVYQTIWLTKYPIIRLLFPLNFVLDNPILTSAAKHDLTLAMIKAGAVAFKPGGHREGPMTTAQLDAINHIFSQSAKGLGVELNDTPSDQKGTLRPNCKPIEKLTGFNWCKFADEHPNRFKLSTGHSPAGVYDVYLRNLVYASATSGYFLAVLNLSSTYDLPQIALVEASKDTNQWTLYRFTGLGAGLGLCQKDDDGWVPDRCWRKFDIVYNDKSGEMIFDGTATLVGTRE